MKLAAIQPPVSCVSGRLLQPEGGSLQLLFDEGHKQIPGGPVDGGAPLREAEG